MEQATASKSHFGEAIAMGSEMKQYCGFTVGNDLFAVPVLDVQEVIRPPAVTRVPLAKAGIRGLINLRGQIVTAVSLRTLLGLPESQSSEFMNVIARVDDSLVALVVDQIRDVMNVTAESFEPTPDTLASPLRDYVLGVHKVEGRLLIVLDLNKVLGYFDN